MTSEYMNNLYRDLLSNSPQTVTIPIPSDMGTGQIAQVVTKQGAVVSDWKMNYFSDMNVRGINSEGLHQAIEAKEHVKVERENKTLATITYQNYFRMYKKLSGMTGTAKTEEEEFNGIYNLDVVCIPTNKPMIRKDQNDVIYRTVKAKYNAVDRKSVV